MLICPKCKKHLKQINKSYVCDNHHCYDIAKSGYTNLLLSNQMNSKNPGDNKDMIQSRHNFFDQGYYNMLQIALTQTLNCYTNTNSKIVDIGCGEGYYTHSIALNCAHSQIIGIDISKSATEIASKNDKLSQYFVASAFQLPIADCSVDIITNIFAPSVKSEFIRILKPNGYFVKVIPGEKHLIELKKHIYDNAYLNTIEDTNIEGFDKVEETNIIDTITIDNNADINNLFQMTPYYYKTTTADRNKVNNIDNITTTVDFIIRVYKKILDNASH